MNSQMHRPTQAKSAARTAETAAEVIATENDGSYLGPGGVPVDNLIGAESTFNGASLAVTGVTDDVYTVTVASPTGNTFSIKRKAGGTTEFTCMSPGTAGCPSDGHSSG